jgi:hypothetical protein
MQGGIFRHSTCESQEVHVQMLISETKKKGCCLSVHVQTNNNMLQLLKTSGVAAVACQHCGCAACFLMVVRVC